MPLARLWSTLLFLFVSLAAMAQQPFITTWQTTTANEDITLRVNPNVTGYNYTVDWGDGNTDSGLSGEAAHTYATADTYTISITGNFPALHQPGPQLLSVEQWGDITWKSMEEAFMTASNLKSLPTDAPNLSDVTSMARMFRSATSFNADISGWDVSSVQNMEEVFAGASSFNGDLSGWNTSNVTNMAGMFQSATSFNQGLSSWDVSSVEDMERMFLAAASFNGDLSGWVPSNVTTMAGMFQSATSFNQGLSSWDVSSVENMEGMFLAATSFNGDLSGWVPSNVTNMVGMLQSATSFDQHLGDWNITSVERMDGMLIDAGLSPANYDATLIGWAAQDGLQRDVVLDAGEIGYCAGADARQQLMDDFSWTINDAGEADDCDGGGIGPADPDHFITVWNTEIDAGTGPYDIKIPATGEFTYTWVNINEPAVTGSGNGSGETFVTFTKPGIYEVRIAPTGSDPFHAIQLHYNFVGNDAAKLLEVRNWGTVHWSKFVFYGCENLKVTAADIPDLSGVTDLSFTFSLSGIDIIPNINDWDISNVTDLSNMFEDVAGFNQSLDNWDVSDVTNMSFMFKGATSFNQPLDSWDVRKLENFDYMFRDAASFDQSLAAWKLESLGGAVFAFTGSGMSCENFSYSLYSWATNPNTNHDAILGGSGVTYSPDVAPYVDKLRDERGWRFQLLEEGTCSVVLPDPPIEPGDNHILYVDVNVNTAATGYTGVGDSWENAIPELADALKWAREQHDGGSPGWTEAEPLRIFVAKGTYLPLYHAADGQYTTDGGRDNSFVLVPNVQLYGGFDPVAGIETLEDARILPNMNSLAQGSILSGDFNGNDNTANYDNHTENAHHVTIASGNVGSALMDGFTVTGGYARGNTSGSSVMGRTVYRFFGGGTYVITSSPQFTHMAWFNNVGDWGGGLFNTVFLLTEISAPELANVTFYRNMAPGGGGGIRNFGGSIDIKQAIFANNGAGLVEDGTSSGPGGGIHSSGNGTSLSVTNATFYGNWIVGVFIPQFDGGAIYVEQTSTLLNNVVIWENEVEGDPTDPSASISISNLGGDVTVANSLVAHSGGSANWNHAMGILDGGNNIDTDPVFVSTTPGDAGYLQLSACSPAIGAGSNQLYIDAGGDLADDLDMSGNPRVYDFAGDGVIDMGAYEYQGERIYIEQLTMPDAVQVVYGTEMGDIEGLPTTVAARLSDETDVSLPLDGNLANWTLASPAGGTYDGDVAGTYVFTVPLLIPETECYLNPENLQAEVTIVVAKGTPVLTAAWNGTSIDLYEGLSLTYGNVGELAFSTTDTDGDLTYAFGDDDVQVLDLADLDAVAARQAGTATLTIEQEETANYEAASIALMITVAPKTIAIVPSADQGKVYGADEPAGYGYALAAGSMLAFDDELTDIVSAALREVGEDVGAYDIELAFEGELADNYDITFEAGNDAFVITPLEIMVTAADKTKAFGSDDPALTYTFTPELIGEDAFTGKLEREGGDDLGSYLITQGDLSLSDNYEITFEEGMLTIAPADYEGVAFDDVSFVYDGTEHTLELTGELPEGASVSYEIDGEPGNSATDAGTYAVIAFIDGGANYGDVELTATLTITPLEVTVTATDKTKVFGADDPAFTYTFTPELVVDDAFSGNLARAEGETVGDYAITQGDLSLGDNYEITFEAGKLTITQQQITGIAFNSISSTYDGTEQRLILAGELPAGASVTYEIEGKPGNRAMDAGTYDVTAYIDGGQNYEDDELTATLTIAPLEITVTAADKTKAFGTDDPALTYTFTPGLIGDDVFVGDLNRDGGEDVGDYAITQGDLSLDDNYTLVFEAGTLTITQRQITGLVFENTSFTYDGTEHILSLAGDLPAGASVTYENNGRTHVGRQMVKALIDGDGNYQNQVLEAILTVLPATRTLDFPALPEKTYGDAAFDAGATATSGEAIVYISSNPDVAEVTAEGEITITGAGETTITAMVPENANYSNRPQESQILTVHKASQTITLDGPAEVNRDAGSIELPASSTSGLPVTLTADNFEVATLNGAALNILRLGRVTITATQAGDANHEAAEPVALTIRVVDPTSDLPVRVHPVISPNGDGINEFLMIEAITDYPENRVTIFNRNGTLLWEARGYDNNRVAFRGMSTGQLRLPAGTYFYIVEVKDGNTWKHEKGWFVLRY